MIDWQSLRVPEVALGIVIYQVTAVYFYTLWQSKSDRSLLNGYLGLTYVSGVLLLGPMYILSQLDRSGYLPESFMGLKSREILGVSLLLPVFLMMPRYFRLTKR